MQYLEKYKPQTSVFDNYTIDESLPEADQAFASWKALLSAKRGHDGLFLVIGFFLKKFKDNEWFRFLDYESFSQFLNADELGFSREKAYMCIKTYEYYIEYLELDPDKVGEMNVSRLSMMVPELKKIESKHAVIQEINNLNTLSHSEFVREIKKRSNHVGKPQVWFSEDMGKFIVNYYSSNTVLQDLGEYAVGNEVDSSSR